MIIQSSEICTEALPADRDPLQGMCLEPLLEPSRTLRGPSRGFENEVSGEYFPGTAVLSGELCLYYYGWTTYPGIVVRGQGHWACTVMLWQDQSRSRVVSGSRMGIMLVHSVAGVRLAW